MNIYLKQPLQFLEFVFFELVFRYLLNYYAVQYRPFYKIHKYCQLASRLRYLNCEHVIILMCDECYRLEVAFFSFSFIISSTTPHATFCVSMSTAVSTLPSLPQHSSQSISIRNTIKLQPSISPPKQKTPYLRRDETIISHTLK